MELANIWRISSGIKGRLTKLGITTPLQFRDADPHSIRDAPGVVYERKVLEPRGESRIPFETDPTNKQNICCSRSLGKVIYDPGMLREA